MQIDGFTVLLCGFVLRTLLGLLFLLFWMRDRRATWFAWWSATFLLGDAAAIFYVLDGFAATMVPVGLDAAAVIAAFGCCWQGARAFEGRAPLWLPLLGAPALWLLACFIPGFTENLGYRVVLSSLLIASLIGMSAVEFWRGRHEPLPSRWAIIALFASFSLVFASRIPLAGLLPFPFGALPMQTSWVATFALILILHTTLLAVLIVAMSRERLEREQHVEAQTDLLTGVLNRRAFMTYAERLILRSRMEGKPLCVMLLDIDHFKSLNDRFGHFGGDAALMKFVAIVRDGLRPGDFLFRLGGDEFCCLLPETTTGQALQAGERVRSKVASAIAGVTGASVRMTTSMGIASTETFGYDLEALMHHADMAVYAAKRQGRNRVVVATGRDDAVSAMLARSGTGEPLVASAG